MCSDTFCRVASGQFLEQGLGENYLWATDRRGRHDSIDDNIFGQRKESSTK